MNDAGALVGGLRAVFASRRTRAPEWRKEQLRALLAMIESKGTVIADALGADMRKPKFEAWAGELRVVAAEVQHALANLDAWMAPRPVEKAAGASRAFVVAEPLGVVLILGPWNYPAQLALLPLVGAIAAGNAAVVKPSEVTPHTSRALFELCAEFLDKDAVRVVEGGAAEATALLEHRFDHVFFTGGGRAGAAVYAAAAKHLTPVTLELGGKNPCVVLRDCDLAQAAKRVAWGKFLNAGQVCVAPDYLLVDAPVRDAFVAELKATLAQFYGADPRASADYGRIVNEAHARRLAALLDGVPRDAVVHGGDVDFAARYVAPTLILEPPRDAAIMKDEIFGPLLPIYGVEGLDGALAFLDSMKDKPLALYLFSNDEEAERRVVGETSSGGVAINDTVVHIVPPELPFGGVGASGIGAYHGRHSFDLFSHQKSVFRGMPGAGAAAGRFPPHKESLLRFLQRLR